MIKIDVKFDMRGLKRDLDKIQRNVIPKAHARALNRSADGVKAEAVRTLSKLTGIKQGEIRSRMWVRGATPQRLTAEVDVLGYAPNLKRFQARKTKKGIEAKAWGQRKVYKGSFSLPSGAVVSRTGRERAPLKKLYGPSVPRTFMRDAVIKRLKAVAEQRWRSEFEREMARRLKALL